MKFLLDTHIWVWSVLNPERLGRRVARALEKPGNELWLSPLSIWEVLLLVEGGRVRLRMGFDQWLGDALGRSPVREAPLTAEMVMATRDFQSAHRDPVDLFLLATAKVMNLTLVTSDERLLGIRGIATLANR